jgi:hypothetical protein
MEAIIILEVSGETLSLNVFKSFFPSTFTETTFLGLLTLPVVDISET